MSMSNVPPGPSGPSGVTPLDEEKSPAKLIIGLVLGALALLFVFQNTGKGEVNFLFWDISAPAWLWLLTTFVVGVAVGLFLPKLRRRSQEHKAQAAKKSI